MSASRTGELTFLFALFLISGATGLIYEVVWLRQLVLIFGSTQFATSTILSTFMGGLALGAFLAGRWYVRMDTPPLRVYGLLEIGIGLYALVVPFLFQGLSPIYRYLWSAGASESFLLLSLAKFVGIALVLLPPTVLMGASLPVLARQVADDEKRIGGEVGGLYAINIVGAVLGVFLAGFVTIPRLGVQATIGWTAAFNVTVGLLALAGATRLTAKPTPPVDETASATTSAEGGRRAVRIRVALLVFGLSGFGALVLEVAWTRVLTLVLGSSVYAFSLMLLAFLIGLAAGGGAFSAWLQRRPQTDPAALLAWLLAGSGICAFVSAHMFRVLPRFTAELLIALDPGPQGWFFVQFVSGLLVMFPTTFLLGGIFPAVLQLHARRLAEVSTSVGTVYAANTVGTIVGAAIGGFVLIPGLGVLNTVVAVACTQLLLAVVVAAVLASRQPMLRWGTATVGLALLVALAVAPPRWDGLVMNSGVFYLFNEIDDETTWEDYMEEDNETVPVFEAEGLTAHVFVADEPKLDNRYLSVNGKVEASTQSDMETQLLSSHLPLLMHDDPQDVFVIGLASGITAGAAASHPVRSIRIAEIEPKIIEAARLFDEANGHVLDDPRVVLSINDARNELEFSPQSYDVIISEPSNPWMTIAANLFTEDFFEIAGRRLRPGAIYCQWVQNYYLSSEDLRSVISAFHSQFPSVLVFEVLDGVDLLLLGSHEPLRIDPTRLEQRMGELRVRLDLARVDIYGPADLLSAFRMGEREVARLVRGAPRNTDNNARVEFNAPRTLGRETLGDNLSLLRRFRTDVLDYVEPPIENPEERDRLRLELAEALIDRGQYDMARRSVLEISADALRDRASELLAFLDEKASGG